MLWSGSVAGHRDHLEVLVELDVVLAVLTLGVIDFKVATALGSFSNLLPMQPRISRASSERVRSARFSVASKISALTIANGPSLSEIASKFLKFCCVRLSGMVTGGAI